MRACLLMLALALVSFDGACESAKPGEVVPVLSDVGAPKPSPSATPRTRVDFDAQVRPILESRCTPCHFAGGTMYARLPFDRPGTIRTLGTKLFTRIKDEKEQQLIRDFLTQQAQQNQDRP